LTTGWEALLLRSELVLLESSHELGGETEGPPAQASLGTAARVMDKGDSPLVHFLLVEKLVLDDVHVDKVAHVRTRVPSNVVGIDVNFPEHADHLSLVNSVRLRAGSSGSRVGRGVVKVRLRWDLDDGEGEGVCDFENAAHVHTNDRTGRSRRECLRAVLDNFHNDLGILHELPPHIYRIAENLQIERGIWREFSYQGLDLDGRERDYFFPVEPLVEIQKINSKTECTYSAILNDAAGV